MSGSWGQLAREHWQRHLPQRLAALADPDGFLADLEQEATAQYVAIRDAQLRGADPYNGTIDWAEFLDRAVENLLWSRDIDDAIHDYTPGSQHRDLPATGPLWDRRGTGQGRGCAPAQPPGCWPRHESPRRWSPDGHHPAVPALP